MTALSFRAAPGLALLAQWAGADEARQAACGLLGIAGVLLLCGGGA